MRTKAEAIENPPSRDMWSTIMLRRTIIKKKQSCVGVKTEGNGRQTTIELMELFVFRRWAKGAEYVGVAK